MQQHNNLHGKHLKQERYPINKNVKIKPIAVPIVFQHLLTKIQSTSVYPLQLEQAPDSFALSFVVVEGVEEVVFGLLCMSTCWDRKKSIFLLSTIIPRLFSRVILQE